MRVLRQLGDIIKMSDIIEVEHDNLILSKELIDVYKKRIEDLENEVRELKLQIKATPIYVIPQEPPRPRIRTFSELKTLLEVKSIPKVE